MFALFNALLLCTTAVAAQSHNNVTGNSTIPKATGQDRIGWKSSPDGRSTMNIIWSCLAILLVCTYKCVHLNIPSFAEQQAGWHTMSQLEIPYWPEKALVRKWLGKLKWMAIVLVAPEIGVVMAINQYLLAREEVSQAKMRYPGEVLTLTHGFYSISGGFAAKWKIALTADAQNVGQLQGGLRTSPNEEVFPIQPPAEPIIISNSPRTSLVVDKIRGSRDGKSSLPDIEIQSSHDLGTSEDSPLFAVSLVSYIHMCKESLGPPSPIITEHDINDRSKTDSFTKLFAISQSAWLLMHSIARVSAGLPITELELMTMAYVLCALMMYGFWWYKPFDAEHVTIVTSEHREWRSYWKKCPELNGAIWSAVDLVELMKFSSHVSNVLYAVTIAFSAIHLAAWNWEFPHPVAQILWRSFAVGATASAPLLILWLCLSFLYDYSHPVTSSGGSFDFSGIGRQFLDMIIYMSLAIFYTTCRLGLLVLVCYSFCSMPAGVYETVEWTTYFPHFS